MSVVQLTLDIFFIFPSIEYNDLTSIEFGKVDPDAPSVVERIRLRYNNLNALPLGLDLFTGLLESFRLDDNPIGALTADEAAILTNTPVLNDLSLENCSLRHVPDVTSGLNSGVVLSIDLTSNPLLCDRNLEWLKSGTIIAHNLSKMPILKIDDTQVT